MKGLKAEAQSIQQNINNVLGLSNQLFSYFHLLHTIVTCEETKSLASSRVYLANLISFCRCSPAVSDCKQNSRLDQPLRPMAKPPGGTGVNRDLFFIFTVEILIVYVFFHGDDHVPEERREPQRWPSLLAPFQSGLHLAKPLHPAFPGPPLVDIQSSHSTLLSVSQLHCPLCIGFILLNFNLSHTDFSSLADKNVKH